MGEGAHGHGRLLFRVGIELREDVIPVRDDVRGACEILGFDPLYVANEGKLVASVPPEGADATLATMRAHPLRRTPCAWAR